MTGLQLAVLSLRGTADPARFIQGFTGSNRNILDYLTEEVLEQQPDEVMRTRPTLCIFHFDHFGSAVQRIPHILKQFDELLVRAPD